MIKINHTMMICLFAVLFMFCGCVQQYKVPDYSLLSRSGEFAVEKKIDLRVGFVQSKALKSAKMNILNYEYEEGRLAKNTNELATLLFKDVTTIDMPKKTDDFDAYLTPHLVRTEYVFAGHDKGIIANVFFEWKLEDREQNLIWVDTIKAEEAPVTWNKEEDTAYQRLLDDLFRNSIQAMKSSPEIAKFVNNRTPRSHEAALQPLERQESEIQPSTTTRSEQVLAYQAPVKPVTPGMLTLPNGDNIWNLNGDWVVDFQHYGRWSHHGVWRYEAMIMQKGNSFEIFRARKTNSRSKDLMVMSGKLDKKGFKDVTVITYSGIFNMKGEVTDDGNKLSFDDGEKIRAIYLRKKRIKGLHQDIP